MRFGKEVDMKTLLVPLDGSELAARIVPHVRSLAANLSARVLVLHVVTPSEQKQFFAHNPEVQQRVATIAEGVADKDPAYQERLHLLLHEYVAQSLEPAMQALKSDGLDVELEVLIGAPAEHIVETAKRREVSLIAMATHGYSGIRRWALGSITDKVVHATDTPVFVLRGDSQRAPTIGRVLVPLDGSDFAEQALPVALELATHARADIHVLRATLPLYDQPALVRAGLSNDLFAESQAQVRSQAREALAATAAQVRQQDLHATYNLVEGHPAEAIIDEAKRQQSDVIVMATHGYSGIKRWSLGSVADKVLHATDTPLVLVRARE
jgi:nucleotide-binding universal stress UspA family protein